MPQDHESILDRKEIQIAIFAIKDYIEQNLCKELNLIRVTVPLIVDAESGINDYLDRDGSRTPVRKDYFLDHDDSAYVDQWDRELAITEEQRNLDFLTNVVKNMEGYKRS